MVVKGWFNKNDSEFALANVYAPCDSESRHLLWIRLGDLITSDSEAAWCVTGDFNAVRSTEERRSIVSGGRFEDYSHFKHFITKNYLIDIALCGRRFT